jgi:hypothetical protein
VIFCVKSHHYFIYILIQKFLIFTEFVRPKWSIFFKLCLSTELIVLLLILFLYNSLLSENLFSSFIFAILSFQTGQIENRLVLDIVPF